MAVAVWTSFQQITDSDSVPVSGAKINVYAAGTTTPLSVYSDSALSVAAANPIICDSAGQHAIRYIATASYKTAVTTSADVALTGWSKDNIDPGVAIGSGALPVANGGTGATTAGAARTNLAAAAASDVTTLQSDMSNQQTWSGYLLTTRSRIASGTTAQQPAAGTVGLRYNSTTGYFEADNGTNWRNLMRQGQALPSDFATGQAVLCLKRSRTTLAVSQTITSTIPTDNTKPQIGEGTEVTNFNISFTPLSASSSVRVLVRLQMHMNAGVEAVAALFKDGGADAVSSLMVLGDAAAASSQVVSLTYEFSPGALTALGFSVRVGSQAGGQIVINSDGAGTPATLGDTRVSELIVEEWLTP